MQIYGHYKEAAIFTGLAVIAGYLLGGFPIALTVLLLGILETSLSFDNAVINARILKNWDKKWQDRFIKWGIPIAVFGMRLVFPLAIVSIAATLGPLEAIKLAFTQPEEYERILTSVHHEVVGFGGAFLLMIFLDFFFNKEKDHHWLPGENILAKLAEYVPNATLLHIGIAVAILFGVTFALDPEHVVGFSIAGLAGIITQTAVSWLSGLFGEDDEIGKTVVKAGIAGFLYLELIDASFSFDGVIASFALTNNIAVIMLGLGVGAFFVRALTLHMVDVGTLDTYEYLEHGAFWAIGSLVALMFVGLVAHIPEAVTGILGATLIGLAWYTSNKTVVAN